jgi:hypothetical protein
MKKTLILSAVILPLMTGCVVAVSDGEHGWSSNSQGQNWQETHLQNRKAIARLTLGENYNEILEKLSTPQFVELVKKANDEYKVVYFPTHSIHSDGKTTKDECTPLIFKNEQLLGFGATAIEQINQL